jgi:hypothetical protein
MAELVGVAGNVKKAPSIAHNKATRDATGYPNEPGTDVPSLVFDLNV